MRDFIYFIYSTSYEADVINFNLLFLYPCVEMCKK